MSNEDTGKFLAQLLYPDLKNWVVTIARTLKTPVDKARSPIFKSPSELLDALKSNKVKPNSWVTMESKPSMFGPFLRNHFISPIVGNHTNMRLGPPLVSDNPIMAMMGQVTSHLKPVGIYPPIDDDLFQLCLYPCDAEACGMIGLMPGIDQLVEYIPAISRGNNLAFCGMSCNIRGVVRQIDPKLFTDIGIPIEKWEELRQSGNIWFIDLSDTHSEVEPHGDAITTEMWGGLYASGHIEIVEGSLQLDPLIHGMIENFKKAGFEPQSTQNMAGRQEYLIYAKGIRAVIDTKAPVFSIHMDSEISIAYSEYKDKFDAICLGYLEVIKTSARESDTQIANPDDLDFSYTDSSEAYSVLKSSGADNISDPMCIAIRDWHRKRGR